jgi:hypothetical protein
MQKKISFGFHENDQILEKKLKIAINYLMYILQSQANVTQSGM